MFPTHGLEIYSRISVQFDLSSVEWEIYFWIDSIDIT